MLNMFLCCRLSCAVAAGDVVQGAHNERLLLKTYDVRLPSLARKINGERDVAATGVLKMFQPILLTEYTPLAVVRDGNCLFRALSRGLYGLEDHHQLIRLLTALEIADHRDHYDTDHPHYKDLIKDNRLLHDPYQCLLQSASTLGSYSEMMVLYAASAALSVPVQSYCPPAVNTHFLAEPYSKRVYGRAVRSATAPVTTLMWTTTFTPRCVKDFRPNHFVVLHRHQQVTPLIDLATDRHSTPVKDTINLISDITASTVTAVSDDYFPSLSSPATPPLLPSRLNVPRPPCNTDNREPELMVTKAKSDDSDEDVPTQVSEIPKQLISPEISEQSALPEKNTNTNHAKSAPGGYALPAKCSFMDTCKLVEVLTAGSVAPHPHIPEGRKENAYYIFDNKRNLERRQKKQRSQFWDACGAWIGGSSNTTFLICLQGQQLQEVVLKDKVYGTVYQKRTSVGRQHIFTPCDPQPNSDSVIVLHRAYSKHTLDTNYRRRISWLANCHNKVAVAEYTGHFPGLAVHGGSKQESRKYIRTKPTVMDKIKKEAEHRMPNQLWQELNDSGCVGGLRSKRQLSNARYQVKRQWHQTEGKNSNFTDHVQNIESMAKTHEFVQCVKFGKNKVPTVILYTEDQLQDVRRFCCPSPITHSTILGFDKTFNLGDVHVTVGTFKHLAVIRRRTQDHPIFVGPIYLHGNSDYSSYLSFFSHLSAQLRGTPSQPTFGSDDETSLKSAIRAAFPESNTMNCTRHLSQNVDRYLREKIGVPQQERASILNCIFGQNGLSSADEETIFEHRLQETIDLYSDLAPTFDSYFTSRLLPILCTNFTTQTTTRCTTSLINWTNNNCESINHVLKHAMDWKSQQLTTLVLKLYEVVRSQYQDLRKAIAGTGDLALTSHFSTFSVPIHVWTEITKDKRDRHFQKFLKSSWLRDNRTQTSTDGKLVVTAPGVNGGKKINQVKRKRCAKTSTVTKKLKL